MTLSQCFHYVTRSSTVARAGLALTGALTLSVAAASLTPAATAHAASFHYRRGYSVQSGALCYGFANRALHCTRHWRRAASGAYISGSPAWVPSSGHRVMGSGASGGGGGVIAFSGSGPSGVSQWTRPPGYTAYGMRDFAGDPNRAFFGSCTWYAWDRRRDQNGLGMAWQWTNNARARGFATGSAPAAGATVVFQPGVQGASGGGHVGHVERVLGGGWFLISEMNFFWNGGGYGRVSYRYAHTGAGVSFIY